MTESAANTKLEIQQWLAEDTSSNENTLKLRNIMLRFLYYCPESKVLSKARRLNDAPKLIDCDSTYLYTLQELLESNTPPFTGRFASRGEPYKVSANPIYGTYSLPKRNSIDPASAAKSGPFSNKSVQPL